MKSILRLLCLLYLTLIFANSSSGLTQSKQIIQRLQDGDYYYEGPYSSERNANRELIFRKRGNTAIGIYAPYYDDNPCFRGRIQTNNIINIDWAVYRSGEARETWEFSSGGSLSLNNYRRRPLRTEHRQGIEACLRAFRNRRR